MYPNDHTTAPPATDEWVRFIPDPADAERVSIGMIDPLYRFFGLIIIEIFVPLGSGSGRAWELADQAGALFMGGAAPSGFRFLRAPRCRSWGNR